MHISLRAIAVGAALSLAAITAPAYAQVVNYTADLLGSSEVPPNDSAGTGTVDLAVDPAAKTISWTIDYTGLTGPATAAHFHGPAAAGENAKPVVPIKGDLASPIAGEATITDEQLADLQAGKWYFNVHTEKYPDGEIRGQLAEAKP